MASDTPGGSSEGYESTVPASPHEFSRHGGVVLPSMALSTQSSSDMRAQDRLAEQESTSSSFQDVPRNTELIADYRYRVPHLKEVPRRRHITSGFLDCLQSESSDQSADETKRMGSFSPQSKNMQHTRSAGLMEPAREYTPYSSVQSSPVGIYDNLNQWSAGVRATASALLPPKADLSQYMSLREHFNSQPNTISPVRRVLGSVEGSSSTSMTPTGQLLTREEIPGPGMSSSWDSVPVSSPCWVQSDGGTSSIKKQSSPTRATPKATTQPLPASEFSPHLAESGRNIHSNSTLENWTVAHGHAVAKMTPGSSLKSPNSHSLIESSTHNTGDRPEPKEDEPPAWRQKQVARSWKKQRIDRTRYDERFEGAFDILGSLNGDNYQMPYGSRVVSIKSIIVSNILLSLKTGIWACPSPVATRIVNLSETRRSDEEKILFLFSVPGSKTFCGLAEMLSYHPGMSTDLWEGDAVYAGAMVVRWLYCKLVTYDEIRRNVVFNEGESVTQMWNGMHYPEPLGRKVIQAYVMAPHIESMLTKPAANSSRKDRLSSKRGMASDGRSGRWNRPSTRQPNIKRPDNGVESVGSRENHTENKSSPTHALVHRASPGRPHPQFDTGLASSPVPETKDSEQPKLQMVPFYVHADGTMTPAVPLSASSSSFARVHDDGTKTAPLPPVSTPKTPHSPYSFGGMPSSTREAAKPKIGPGRIVGDINRTHHLPASAFFARNDRGDSAKERLRIGTPRSSPNLAGHLQRDWRSASQQSTLDQQTPTSNRCTTKRSAESPIAPPTSGVRRMEQIFSTPPGSVHMQYGSPRHGSHHGPNEKTYLDQGVMLPRQSPRVSQFFADSVNEPDQARHEDPENRRLAFPIVDVMERLATPKPRNTTSFGHRARGSEAGSSMDMRTQTWVDRLLASPGRRNESITPFGDL